MANRDLSTAYDYTTMITSIILIAMFVAVLIRVLLGAKFSFVVIIAILLIVSNVSSIADLIAANNLIKYYFDSNESGWERANWMMGVFSFSRDATFSVANWIFSYEYYRIAKFMPFVVLDREVPASLISRDRLIFWLVLGLNILAPLATSTTGFIANLEGGRTDQSAKNWIIASIVTRYSVGLMQLVSGVFIGVAIYKIRAFIADGTQSSNLNVLILVLHSITFGLYIVSVVVYYVFYTIYYLHWSDESKATTRRVFAAWIFCTVCEFAAQLCIVIILWLFGKKEIATAVNQQAIPLASNSQSEPTTDALMEEKPRTVSSVSSRTVEEEAEDPEADFEHQLERQSKFEAMGAGTELKARMWNQFIRASSVSSTGSYVVTAKDVERKLSVSSGGRKSSMISPRSSFT